MNRISDNLKLWVYIAGVVLIVAVCFALYGVLNKVEGFNSSWEEDFEEYDTGLLYQVAEKWEYMPATPSFHDSQYFRVSSSQAYNGLQSGYVDSSEVSGYTFIRYNPNSNISSGVHELTINLKQVYWYDPNYLIFEFYSADNDRVYVKLFKEGTNFWTLRGGIHEVSCSDGSYVGSSENIIIDTDTLFPVDTWTKLYFKINFNRHTFEISGNNGSEDTDEKCFWFTGNETDETLSYIQVISYRSRAYFDYFNTTEYPEPPVYVWGITPVSGSEITDLESILKIEYEGLNLYDSLYITLKHPQTGIFTDAKQFDIIDIGGSGELEIPLTHFNIEKNGNWYLHAVATYGGYQYEDELFLSGYGWNWTGDLTDGFYYLDINIDGFEEMFFMSDFETWYSENAKFDTPTDMFYDIASVFSPIFSMIGEFGNRIINYFDLDSAYSKGYDIGRSLPIFRYYVEQITHFLGGFPIMVWLLIIILLLVGIFIFRIILKFIPFLG